MTMRLWSLVAALLLPLVSTETTESTTSSSTPSAAEDTTLYPIGKCICDLKLAKEARDDVAASESSERRKREADPVSAVTDVNKRLLFGFELETAIDKANTDTTLEDIRKQIHDALAAAEAELADVYDSTVTAGILEQKKVYMYINLKQDASDDVKVKVDTVLKGKQVDGSPTQWFGKPIASGDHSLIISGTTTVVSISLQLTAPATGTTNEKVKQELDTKVRSVLTAKPILTTKTSFDVRGMVTMEIEFYEDIGSNFGEIHKSLVTMDLPGGYEGNERMVFIGPKHLFNPASFARVTLTVPDKAEATMNEALLTVDTKLKDIAGFERCFATSHAPALQLPVNLQFSGPITDEIKNEIETKLKELQEDADNKVNGFTNISKGLPYMNQPENHLTSIFTFKEVNITDDKKAAAKDAVINKLKEGDVQKKLGAYVSHDAAIDGDKIRVVSTFMPPTMFLSEEAEMNTAIAETFSDFADATLTKVFRGSASDTLGPLTSAQFTVADGADLSSFNQNEFADKLTKETRDSAEKPAHFLWVHSAAKEGDDKINVYFRFGKEEPADTVQDSLEAFLTTLTESDTIADVKLKDGDEFVVPVPGVTTTAPSGGGESTVTEAGGAKSTSAGDDGTTNTSGGGDGATSTPAGGDTATSTPAGGDSATSTPAGGDSSASTSVEGDGATSPTGESGGAATTNSNTETPTPPPRDYVVPETKYKGTEVKADGTIEHCECNLECSVEMTFTATGFQYKETYSDPTSADFKAKSESIGDALDSYMEADASFGPYFIDTIVTKYVDKGGNTAEIYTEVQLSNGYNCTEAEEKVEKAATDQAKDGSFAGLTVEEDSFNFAEGTTDSNRATRLTNDRNVPSTTEMMETTAQIVYEDHDYFLTVTIPVMIGTLLLIILIMCCMRKDSLCCKIFATEASESTTKLIA